MDIDPKLYHKLIFIDNCLNDGWSVKKNDKKYIFFKIHKNRKSCFKRKYLREFLDKNIELKND